MSGLQAALCLYKREVGPIPEKVSHVENVVPYRNFWTFLMCTKVWSIFPSLTSHLPLKNIT